MTNPAIATIPTIIQPLHHRAMNAHLSICCPSFRKTDSKLARKAAEDTGGDVSMHQHTRLLIAKSAIQKITKTISAARIYHNENTSPWEDGGQRILSSLNYPVYMPAMNEFQRDFNAAVDAFVPVYPAIIEQARPLLGNSFNEKDYPHPLRIREKFSFGVKISNLPVSTDFRCPGIGPEEEERVRRQIEERTEAAMEGIVHDLWRQMGTHVNHMVERLKAYDEREERKAQPDAEKDLTGTFRNTLVDNLKELVERLPRLNLTGDTQVEEMRRKMMAQLCAHTAEDLRTSPLTRQHVLKNAEAIQSVVMQQVNAIGDAVSELI